MRLSRKPNRQANVLLCVLCTILIVSVIGGNVLLNCVTRYNTASSQVRSWKESLDAAEAGGDIAYAEVRKTVLDRPNHSINGTGWSYSGGVYSSSPVTFGHDSLSTTSKVDIFYYDFNGNPWYRIRTQGTAPIRGLSRVTMDDRMAVGTRGDSLLRKIDFNYDHFVATYGPNGDNVGKTLLPVSQPQITRRVELVAAPMTPFEAAIKANGTFYGLGSAAYIDSYRSSTGAYDASVVNNPSDPRYPDSRSGNVEINSSVATIMGTIYGNVYTNGGIVTKKTTNITGIIDNNVPFNLPPFYMPTDLPMPQNSPTKANGNTTITPPAAGTAQSPTYYVFSSFNGNLTVNAYGTAQTYVAIHTTSDITGTIDVKPNVHLRVYFDGNVNMKARDLTNETGLAANLQLYGISPTDPSVSQTINISPPGNFAAAIYAPSAAFTMNGNPDITGAIVCKTFYGNGNTSWHYDRQLDNEGDAVDYRIVSYVEDTR
jgi:hypothetical protein